jgi:hypothetical protein
MAAATKIEHPTVEERKARGKSSRDQASPSSHTKWKPAADRPDPVSLLEEQDSSREQDLVPVRHGRMMVSPFTFYRGPAKIMAADLETTPRAGLDVQPCGDAHLSNFGMFASPERSLLFDVNDFDETLPGPFEYDVKRMAASFTIAGRNNGFSKADTRAVTLASARAYRERQGLQEEEAQKNGYANVFVQLRTAQRSLRRSRPSAHIPLPMLRLPEADGQRVQRASATSDRTRDDRRPIDGVDGSERQQHAGQSLRQHGRYVSLLP